MGSKESKENALNPMRCRRNSTDALEQTISLHLDFLRREFKDKVGNIKKKCKTNLLKGCM